MRFIVMLAVLASCSNGRELGAQCDGGDCTAAVHPPGILDPSSPNFHGTLLREINWSFATCQQCHGQDFAGGTSGVSCLQCHAQGPTACVTCHGAGPTSNAHPAHLATGNVQCNECHVVPASWDQDGHILHDGVAITTPPQVVFGARANDTPIPADRAGSAAFDPATSTCTNVYCHGAALGSAGGIDTAPQWTETTPTGSCNRCHGDPPPSHVRTDCATCHPSTVDASGNLIGSGSASAHINGVIDVGRQPGCSGCHGSAQSPAPPVDLEGNTLTTAIGVGAHQAHLQGLHDLAAPIACSACHAVPVTVDSPGHIDHTGPAIVNAALGWDRTSQTCATAWCHGVAPTQATPVWTSQGQVVCGTCHGIPPADGSHDPSTMTLFSCATCHPKTVDAYGGIIITGSGSTHINGVVDVGP